MFFKRFFAIFLCVFFPSGIVSAQPNVVVSIAPLHSVVSVVMQGVGKPDLLLNPEVSVHDYHLKPSDMKRLAKADLLFWGGPLLESFLQKPLIAAGLSDKNVAFLFDPRLTLYPVRNGSKNDIDGHFWLSPENMATVARISAQKLAKQDPDHATLYKSNADRFEKEMRILADKGKQRLSVYSDRPYVTFQYAYQYFEKSFNLTPLGFLSVDPHHIAGGKHIETLREKMKQAQKVCLFAEPQFSDKRLKVIAEDLSVVWGILDPAGINLSPGSDFYTDLMNGLFDSFEQCFKLAE